MAVPEPRPGSGPPAAPDLRGGPGHTLLRLRVTPRASRNEVIGVAGGALRLRIAALRASSG